MKIVAILLLPNAQTGTFWLFVGLVICAAPAFAEPLMGKSRPKKPSVAMVYCEKYEIHLGGLECLHAFDIHKYSKIRKQLLEDKLLRRRDFHVPNSLTREQILLVHTEGFLQSLKNPKAVAEYLEAPIAAYLPARVLDQNVLESFRRASGGTIVAARLALEHGIAVNLGGGYHHAKPSGGEGFCVYADMPIAIRTLQREKRIRRALVVDLDVHQGNGTIVCCKDDPTVFTFSMHQRDIYPVPKEKGDLDIELDAGTDDEAYLQILRRTLPEVMDRGRPDLVFLQAGCDTLRGDPLAELAMTKDGIVERDAYVIDTCVEKRIPIVVLLGGGYSEEAWVVQHASVARTIGKYGVAPRRSGGRSRDD